MEILKQIKNQLLHREEVELVIESGATPSNAETIKKIAEHFKKPEETIVIEHIYPSFGIQNVKVIAKIYDNAESKLKYETVTRKQKKKDREDAKKAEEEKNKAEEDAKKATAEKPEETNPEQEPKSEKAEKPGE